MKTNGTKHGRKQHAYFRVSRIFPRENIFTDRRRENILTRYSATITIPNPITVGFVMLATDISTADSLYFSLVYITSAIVTSENIMASALIYWIYMSIGDSTNISTASSLNSGGTFSLLYM